MGVNKNIYIGNLTRDPLVKSLRGGATVTEFGIAVNNRYYSKAKEEWQEDVLFLDVGFFGPRGEVIAKYLSKGDSVYIEGRLAYRTWNDKETGAKRSKHSLVGETFEFIGGGKGNEQDPGFDKVPF